MADSTSHSVFISIRSAVASRKRILNQRNEHASLLQRNFRANLFTTSGRFSSARVDRAVSCSMPKNNAPSGTHLTSRDGARDPPAAPLVFRDWPGTVCPMNKTVIEVQVRAVLPTSGGCAVFLGNNDKVFIIYVDQTVGSAITMFMREISKERPLTHDLMA